MTQVLPGSTAAVLIAAPSPVDKSACEEAGVLKWRLGVDLCQGDLRHHGVLGERRATHEMADPFAIARDAGAAVGEEAPVLLLADGQAEVGPLVETVHALAALGREEGDDVVAWGKRCHIRANPLDDTGPLVAEHGRRIAGGVRAGGGVEVGETHAAGDEANERLSGPRHRKLDLLDIEWLTEFFEYGGRISSSSPFSRRDPLLRSNSQESLRRGRLTATTAGNQPPLKRAASSEPLVALPSL